MRKAKVVSTFCCEYNIGDIVNVLTYNEMVKLPNIEEYMEKLNFFQKHFLKTKKEKLLYVMPTKQNEEYFFYIAESSDLDFDIKEVDPVKANKKFIKLKDKCPMKGFDKEKVYEAYSYEEILNDKEIEMKSKEALKLTKMFHENCGVNTNEIGEAVYIKVEMENSKMVVGYPVPKKWYYEVDGGETHKSKTTQLTKRKLIKISSNNLLVSLGIISPKKLYAAYNGEELLHREDVAAEAKALISNNNLEKATFIIVEDELDKSKYIPCPMHVWEYTVVGETSTINID